MRKLIMLLMLMTAVCSQGQNHRAEFDKFKNQARAEYKKFRDQAFDEYLKFVKQAWAEYKGEPAVEPPKEEEVVPVLSKDADVETASWFSNIFKRKGKAGKIKTVEGKGQEISKQTVMEPEPIHPQPTPKYEVYESVEEKHQPNARQTFTLFGTEYAVRIGDNCRPTLTDLSPESVAKAMELFKSPQYDDLLYDCLQEREKHNLSDWAYYQMLQTLVDRFIGKGSNEAALVLACLYNQSGYKVRMAHDGTHLYMLAASRHLIYSKDYLFSDGEMYFCLDGRKMRGTFWMCEAKMPKEGSLSLQMSAQQTFSPNPSQQRTITSRKNRDFSFTLTSNKNYMDFYSEYPRSTIGNNFMTQWVMYAETPLEKGIREQLYPAMKQKLQGLSQAAAVQQLLWWVQTGLEYGYDDEVWGQDRAFFGEESLYYPYCDCEDRSILFSHLVRELLDLDVALVYYPGHLAAAVAFTEEVAGNYYMCDGRRFTVCDPTIIPGKVGEIMETMEDRPATLMMLRR